MHNFKAIPIDDLLEELNCVELQNAPEKVFISGDTTILRNHLSIAIIGSRQPTKNGIHRARFLVKQVVKRGGTVVSGLATGIDTAVHHAAIEMGGSTVAVIATPLDKIYPRNNKILQECIARDHLLISQFPRDSLIKPYNFIMRNKTMALVSDATVIIEAGNKSGTIHQAWEAIRLGRPLFILESLANNPNISWPKELIKYGAEVLTRDLLDKFFDMLPANGRSQRLVF